MCMHVRMRMYVSTKLQAGRRGCWQQTRLYMHVRVQVGTSMGFVYVLAGKDGRRRT